MAIEQRFKIVVYVPLSHGTLVREAIGKAGGGTLGNYSFCSFSVRGTGRFLPNEKARPERGEAGKLEEAEEERIEVTCSESELASVIAAIRKTHPYEEIAMDIWRLENIA